MIGDSALRPAPFRPKSIRTKVGHRGSTTSRRNAPRRLRVRRWSFQGSQRSFLCTFSLFVDAALVAQGSKPRLFSVGETGACRCRGAMLGAYPRPDPSSSSKRRIAQELHFNLAKVGVEVRIPSPLQPPSQDLAAKHERMAARPAALKRCRAGGFAALGPRVLPHSALSGYACGFQIPSPLQFAAAV